MFDDNTKQAWQSITPGPELKAKALQQQPKKVVRFPGNLIKTTAAVAACLIIAVNVMGLGESLVSVNGQSVKNPVTLQNTAAFSREVMPLSMTEGITVALTVEEGTELAVSAGTLEGNLWTVDEPGEYLLRAIRGNKVQYFSLTFDQGTGLWTLRPES